MQLRGTEGDTLVVHKKTEDNRGLRVGPDKRRSRDEKVSKFWRGARNKTEVSTPSLPKTIALSYYRFRDDQVRELFLSTGSATRSVVSM